MTPAERLAEAEATLSRHLKHYDRRLSMTVSTETFEFLIARIRNLTSALEEIESTKCEVIICSGGCGNCNPFRTLARKALESEE